MSAEAILKTHARRLIADVTVLGRCLDECGACQATCTICADACAAAVRILGRQTDPHPPTQLNTLEACLAACRACADECELHSHHHEHCRLSAEECRRCERACVELRSVLAAH